ncbi:MAG: AAA family ATPase [Gammaproteobacteria bacterium]|nr:AAA family ATPase [Gammaproteobacteria bacterium]
MESTRTLLINELYILSRRFLDIHHQTYQRGILQDFMRARLGVLIGQRGVGKTTFLIQQLLKVAQHNLLSSEILYVPTDHFLIGQGSLYEIAESFHQMGGKCIAFDEIHHYVDWSKELKSIFDTYPDLTIMASGSSALEIHKGTHDLSRRAVVSIMPGYSLREYLELQHQLTLPHFSLTDLIENQAEITHTLLGLLKPQQLKIMVEFKQYLQTGYYPYYRQLNDPRLYFITLEQNLHYALESDLPNVYPALTGHSIRKIKQLMSFIANTVPFTANLSKLKNMLDIGDERTLKTYLHYLNDSSLIRLCMKTSQKFQKLESPDKIYLDNPNQMYALCPMPPNIGTLRELFFLSMLSYQHEVSTPLQGDFMIDNQLIFEIGGRKKEFAQIQSLEQAFLACDDIEQGSGHKIPLWLFGFLY